MGNIFFTSDNHFGHNNIITYCKRPFLNAEEMDSIMISNWNKTVKPNDTIYCLGDFLFTKDKKRYEPDIILNLLNSLNGKKHLIIGNHDHKNVVHSAGWISSSYLNQVSINGQLIVMCHYSMRVWDQSHRNSWMLYGHSHGTLEEYNDTLSCDVGVDCWDYKPVSFDVLKYKMEKKINNKQPKSVENEIIKQVQQDKNLKLNQEFNNVIIQEFNSK